MTAGPDSLLDVLRHGTMGDMRTQRDIHEKRILEVLAASPLGEMSSTEVMAAMEEKYGHLLNSTDRKRHSNGQEYWQTRAQRTSSYMAEAGLLSRPRRGVWKLTREGLKILEAAAPSAHTVVENNAGKVTHASESGSLMTNTIVSMSLDLQVDDVVTRAQLNASYGGGIQGGMLTPSGGRFIFLFSDPVPGDEYGYTWDGWADGNLDTFFYTGEGSVGDQEFTRRNRILRDAAAEGREVHLFVADGHTGGGSRERTHRYMGQFAVDQQDPWRREEGIDARGMARSAIVFRLNRLNSLPSPQTHKDGRSPTVPERGGFEVIPPEAANATQFLRAAQTESVATRRERTLEGSFHQYLRASGGEPTRLKITVIGQASPLYTDTWDAAAKELYEAKGGVSRSDVRMAIGQLMDYRRHINPPPARCTVLLPSDPGNDLTELIHSVGMDLVFQDGHTFTRRAQSTPLKYGVVTESSKHLKNGAVAASFPLKPKGVQATAEGTFTTGEPSASTQIGKAPSPAIDLS